MSSDNYEYECMRADLLGLDQPPQPALEDIPSVAADPEGLVLEGEQISSTSTKLDELNSIIDSTKKKLTRYQRFCGRLGSILSSPKKGRSTSKECLSEDSVGITVKEKPANCKSSDEPIEREVERQIDKLDSMIMKFERAELSLHQNNKLIKNIVKKKSSEAHMDNEEMEERSVRERIVKIPACISSPFSLQFPSPNLHISRILQVVFLFDFIATGDVKNETAERRPIDQLVKTLKTQKHVFPPKTQI